MYTLYFRKIKIERGTTGTILGKVDAIEGTILLRDCSILN